MNYKKKVVAFVDLLGFSEASKIPENQESVERVLFNNNDLVKLLMDLQTIPSEPVITSNLKLTKEDLTEEKLNKYKEYGLIVTFNEDTFNVNLSYNKKLMSTAAKTEVRKFKQMRSNEVKITTFSDSIFLSYPEELLSDLLKDLVKLCKELANIGFFLRGGVSYGDISDNTFFYGPALIAAHDLECKDAVYPRIILDDTIISNNENSLIKPNSLDAEKLVNVQKLITKDLDDRYFIDFLNFKETDILSLNRNTKATESILENISNTIKNNLKKYKYDPSVLLKYLWLSLYLNRYIDNNVNDRNVNQKIDLNLLYS